jgi:predicted transcriptional regulator
MSPLKEKAHEIVDRLSEDATWSDLAYEIEVRRKIEEGLRDLDEGRAVSHEEVRERFLGQ